MNEEDTEELELTAIGMIPQEHAGFPYWDHDFISNHRILVLDNGLKVVTITVTTKEAREYKIGDIYKININKI